MMISSYIVHLVSMKHRMQTESHHILSYYLSINVYIYIHDDHHYIYYHIISSHLIIETLLTNLKIMNEEICTLHANYISGNVKKMNRMKEYGFWLAIKQPNGTYSDKCLDYVPKQQLIVNNNNSIADSTVVGSTKATFSNKTHRI